MNRLASCVHVCGLVALDLEHPGALHVLDWRIRGDGFESWLVGILLLRIFGLDSFVCRRLDGHVCGAACVKDRLRMVHPVLERACMLRVGSLVTFLFRNCLDLLLLLLLSAEHATRDDRAAMLYTGDLCSQVYLLFLEEEWVRYDTTFQVA